MSRFNVEWSPDAEDQLATIWLRTAPADRPAVNLGSIAIWPPTRSARAR
jgi:hypothetical protein